MIHIKQLSKAYGNSFSLDIPELLIKNEEIVGIVGNNGAGKTTLLRALLDLIELDEGKITINGYQVGDDECWKEITGSYLDESFLIDHMTPFEYFKLCAQLYDINAEIIEDKINANKRFLSSVNLYNKLIRELSSGNKKKVGIVSSLFVAPQLIILDEPFVSLDPTSKIQLKNILKKINTRDQVTVVLSSHNLDYISEICEKVILLDNGCIKKRFNHWDHNRVDIESAFKKKS